MKLVPLLGLLVEEGMSVCDRHTVIEAARTRAGETRDVKPDQQTLDIERITRAD